VATMSNNVAVLAGNGNGTFGAAHFFGVGSGPQSIAVADFNGDGRPDLATANYFGTSDGSFAPTSLGVSVLLNDTPVPGGSAPRTSPDSHGLRPAAIASATGRSTPNSPLPFARTAEATLPGLPADLPASTQKTPARADQPSPALREEGGSPAVISGEKTAYSRTAAERHGLTTADPAWAGISLQERAILDEPLAIPLVEE
jgi:hypothetical protein